MSAFLSSIWHCLRGGSGGAAASGDPARLDDGEPAPDPRRVREVAEEYAWIAAHPCDCGGRWQLHIQHALKAHRAIIDVLAVRCERCGADRTFRFEIRDEPGGKE
jgi:hypothetical protein